MGRGGRVSLWPTCALRGCGWPALAKVEMVEEGRPISVYLCPVHILEIKECLEAIASAREEERLLYADHENPELGQ